MSEHQPIELPSYETLAQLAREDPQAFESLRRAVIDSFIDSAPDRLSARLRGLQFRVDCERQLSHSALGATVRMYALMWESFLRLNDAWQSFMRLDEDGEDSIPTSYLPNRHAHILELRPRSPHDPT